MRIAVFIVLAGVLSWVNTAAAADRLVDEALVPCTKDGVPVHPTIGAAVAAAAPGETIVVCPGTYSEHVTVDKADLTLQAKGRVNLVGPGTPGPGFRVTASGVTIRGFDISGYVGGPFDCGVEATGADVHIHKNRAHGNKFGICAIVATDP